MYKINVKNPFINWNLLYYGIDRDLLSPDTANEYASEYLESNPEENNPFIIDLLIVEGESKSKVISTLNKLIREFNVEETARVLRYVITDNLKSISKDSHSLLSVLEDIYEDFDYPEDMESFISYMPVTDKSYDPLKHSKEENIARLIEKFDIFLEKEKNFINDLHNG